MQIFNFKKFGYYFKLQFNDFKLQFNVCESEGFNKFYSKETNPKNSIKEPLTYIDKIL